MRIRLTRHAREAIAERGLEIDWVERVLRNPAMTEREDRMLRVVYTVEDDGVRVLTAFLDRRARRI